MTNSIDVKHLKFKYTDHQEHYTLDDLSFHVKQGEWLSIIGHNGSGKSTTVRLIDGLLAAESGQIFVEGELLTEENVWNIRHKIGMVFQNPDNQFVGATVEDDVAFGLENKGIPLEEMQARVKEVLELVGMSAFADREPAHLSGGQKQRVAIAGAIAMRPNIIILDEATSMLDPEGRLELIQTIKEIRDQYNMTVVGNLFVPKNLAQNEKAPAIIVGHPMGAVKEQSANLYATKMAEQGFVTLAMDLSFWGESEGLPRNSVSSDIYAEDFSAAVDYLGTRDFVDKDRIGVIGICGSGSFAISEAKIDSRLKAIATVSMYDMGTATRSALGHSQSVEQRKEIIKEASNQRYSEFLGQERKYTSGTADKLSENPSDIENEFYDFYRTTRGYSANTTTHPTLTSNVKFMNFYPFNDIETISPRPLLFIAGEDAHSKEFSEDAYKLAAEPKELYIVPNAGHVDLYDRTDVIPFAKLTEFFKDNL